MALNFNFGRVGTTVAIVTISILVLVGGGFGIYKLSTREAKRCDLEIALSVNSTFTYVRNKSLQAIEPKSTTAVAKTYSIKKGESVKVTLKLTLPETGKHWVIKENDTILEITPTEPTDDSIGLMYLFDVKMDGNKKITYYEIDN
jgi:hypothetical protein